MRLPVHKFSSSHLIKLRGKVTEIKYKFIVKDRLKNLLPNLAIIINDLREV